MSTFGNTTRRRVIQVTQMLVACAALICVIRYHEARAQSTDDTNGTVPVKKFGVWELDRSPQGLQLLQGLVPSEANSASYELFIISCVSGKPVVSLISRKDVRISKASVQINHGEAGYAALGTLKELDGNHKLLTLNSKWSTIILKDMMELENPGREAARVAAHQSKPAIIIGPDVARAFQAFELPGLKEGIVSGLQCKVH